MDALNEVQARAAIVAMGRRLIAKQLVAGSWGNISCLTDEDTLAITPSGRGYETLTDEDVVLLDRRGEVVAGKHVPSSESRLHVAIYAACPEARAVIHTHSVYASALAAMHEDVPALIEDIVQICGGRVRCARYALPGTQELANAAVEALQGQKAALLANHGAVCWGKSLEDALIVAEVLEKAAKIALICRCSGGKLFELDAQDMRIMHSFYEEHYSLRQMGKE